MSDHHELYAGRPPGTDPLATAAFATAAFATDVLVIGGGAAGLTASLVLARARHRVTVIDDNTHRNRAVAEFHGFPTRDATAPAQFRADALRELHRYHVDVHNTSVRHVATDGRTVTAGLATGATFTAAAIVLATGVHDDLPAIDGLAERWGRSVFNCPFCDGWEHRDEPVVVIDAAPGTEHLAQLLRSWTSKVTVVKGDDVAALRGEGTTLSHVVLRDGSTHPATAAFVKAPISPRNDCAKALGCALDADGYVITDGSGATTQPLVWAAGDLRRPPPSPHQVVLAAADGSTAAIAIHRAFVGGSLGTSRTPSSTATGAR